MLRCIMCFLSIILAAGCVTGCGSGVIERTGSTTGTVPTSGSGYLATVEIGTTPGQAISPTFMGLSHEWGVQDQMGSSATGVDAIYRQMLKNLMAYGSGLILRIGGNSTDTTGEPTATTVVPFAELAKSLGVHFYLGVNLGSNNVNLAMDQTKAYVNQMPTEYLDGIEIGNEPDDYVQNKMRAAPYIYQDYLADFNIWKTSIAPLLPKKDYVIGAAWSDNAMLLNAPDYLSSESGSLATFSQHNYMGSVNTLSQDDVLLQSRMTTTSPSAVASTVVATHNEGIPFRIGELGAFYDCTSTSVNNAFEASLWAIDLMFEYANVGVDGVNWHGNPSAGALFTSFNIANIRTGRTTTYSLLTVRPLYYGLLLFQEATGNGAHLLPVTLSTSANFKAWATIDSSNTPRLVIINKEKAASGTVSITMSGYTQVKVLRLDAPSYLSTTGVTLAGQTFDGSTDGTIQGTQSVETYSNANGIFKIAMPVTSAALVIFSN